MSPGPAPIGAAAAAAARSNLLKSFRGWSGVDLKITPQMPKQPPEFVDHYIDPANPLFAPLLHALQAKGSSLHRVYFTRTINKAIGAEKRYVNHIVEIGQTLHNCSLLVDDLCDNTTTRRGHVAAHKAHGMALTLHAAYSTLFNIFLSITAHLGTQTTQVALEECARMHFCNGMEIEARNNNRTISEEEYYAIVDGKTGSGFRIITRMLLALAEEGTVPDAVGERLRTATDRIGRFFQIRDDYMDIASEEYAAKKGMRASDFYEGKFTFPTLHCIRERPEFSQEFKDVFQLPEEKVTPEMVDGLVARLGETKSLEYTLNQLKEEATAVKDTLLEVREMGHDTTPVGAWFANLVLGTPGLEPLISFSERKALEALRAKFLDKVNS